MTLLLVGLGHFGSVCNFLCPAFCCCLIILHKPLSLRAKSILVLNPSPDNYVFTPKQLWLSKGYIIQVTKLVTSSRFCSASKLCPIWFMHYSSSHSVRGRPWTPSPPPPPSSGAGTSGPLH